MRLGVVAGAHIVGTSRQPAPLSFRDINMKTGCVRINSCISMYFDDILDGINYTRGSLSILGCLFLSSRLYFVTSCAVNAPPPIKTLEY